MFGSRNSDTQNGASPLFGLIVGLIAGGLIYAIVEFWIDETDDAALAISTGLLVITSAFSVLMLAQRGDRLRAIVSAALIAGVLFLLDFYLISIREPDGNNLTESPIFFWLSLARPLVLFLALTLISAIFASAIPPAYPKVFDQGISLPVIAIGAKLIALLTLLLLFAWARLLKEFDVLLFDKLFQEPGFLYPFLGAVGGLSIALMHGQRAVIAAIRFVILLFCRITILVTALFTVTLAMVLATKGISVLLEASVDRPAAIMIALAFAGMLIFNGVYQDGQSPPPALWLRIAAIVTLIGFPIYSCLAFYAFILRIEDYGLTPPRIIGITIAGMSALYSIVCIAGLLSELRWRSNKWMPPVAPLNTAMAVLWIIVLCIFASPLVNPWAMSAKSQYEMVANGKIDASKFDYGYLKFNLGHYGDAQLEKLRSLETHPDFAYIRAGVEAAEQAANYWEYRQTVRNPDGTP